MKKRREDEHLLSRRAFLRRAGTGLAAGAALAAAPTTFGLAQADGWDRETDVLVLGAGVAGYAAAIAAAEAGRRVLVVERAANPGGSSRRSGGVIYLGGGTAPQLANGFDDTPDNMYDYLLPAMGIGADPARVRAYCDGSVDLYEWLVAAGVPFNDKYVEAKITQTSGDETLYYSGSERSHPYVTYATPMPRGHKTASEGSAGHVLMDALHQRAVELSVDFVYDARATDLLMEDGAVVGAAVQHSGGTWRIHGAGGVVVTTGGFQFNRDMVSMHCPQYLQTAAPLGAPEEDGDGLTMGQKIGAQVHMLDRGSPWKFMYPPDAMVKSLLVNPHGMRFITEDIYGGNACDLIVRRFGSVAYLIYDETVRAELGAHADNLTPLASADTVEALAEQLELPPSVLANTFSFYNQHAANGEDPIFHKESKYVQPLDTGPYYALDYSGVSGSMVWITLGGLRTDNAGRVISAATNAPIPGLYSAGRASAGIGGVYNSGTSLGDGLFFGRAAGRDAASHASARRHLGQHATT